MSDEVSQFLEQVERLRGQQIEEDEVRARELEEYMVAKRERQARREGKSCLLCSYVSVDSHNMASLLHGWRRFRPSLMFPVFMAYPTRYHRA